MYKITVPKCEDPEMPQFLVHKNLIQESYIKAINETSKFKKQIAKHFSAFKMFCLKKFQLNALCSLSSAPVLPKCEENSRK